MIAMGNRPDTHTRLPLISGSERMLPLKKIGRIVLGKAKAGKTKKKKKAKKQ